MGRFKVVGSFVCEGELLNSTSDEEAPRIFRNRLQSLLRTSFKQDVHVTIMKCERMKEKGDD